MRRSAPVLAALVLAASAPPARAIPMPETMFELGRSFAVDTPVDGAFDQGGFATAFSVLWPIESFLRMGASLYADDMGSLRVELTDASQNPPVPLGVFDVAHVNLYGGAWRMDILGPHLGRFDTFVSGSWGVYRFRADQHGDYLTDETKLGWNLGGAIMFPLRHNHALGATFAFDRVFSDLARDYMSAGLAWHWRPGRRPQASGSKK